jgi:hypothetical protein
VLRDPYLSISNTYRKQDKIFQLLRDNIYG